MPVRLGLTRAFQVRAEIEAYKLAKLSRGQSQPFTHRSQHASPMSSIELENTHRISTESSNRPRSSSSSACSGRSSPKFLLDVDTSDDDDDIAEDGTMEGGEDRAHLRLDESEYSDSDVRPIPVRKHSFTPRLQLLLIGPNAIV